MHVHSCYACMYLPTSPGSRSPSARLLLRVVNSFDAEVIPHWRNTLFIQTSFAYVHFSFEVNPRFFIFLKDYNSSVLNEKNMSTKLDAAFHVWF